MALRVLELALCGGNVRLVASLVTPLHLYLVVEGQKWFLASEAGSLTTAAQKRAIESSRVESLIIAWYTMRTK